MNISKMLGIICLAAVLLTGCGSVDRSTDTQDVRSTETTTATSPVVTADISEEETQAISSDTAETPAVTEAQTTKVTTASDESSQNAATILLGEEGSSAETTAQTAQEISGGQQEQANDNNYAHDKPMGNEVLPQSLDYYVTQTEPQQTEPPVTEQPQVQETQTAQQGVTSKGYKIEIKNGVTYVDGVLIVNKTYELPQDYGNGLDPTAQQAFYEMQSAAANDGIWLTIVSGYRSYWYQDQLYWNYVYTRGGQAEVDRFSARAGHSEHQTGLSMDLNNASRYFAGTPEAQWIEQHCADYGFIVRYPDGKEDVTGFMYEPWHVRYVGKELAGTLTDQGMTLEEYFGISSQYNE